MRFYDFKLTEASNLSTSELVGKPARIPTFLNKIKTGSEFQLVGGGTVKIDPSEYERVQQFLVPGAAGQLKLKTADGATVLSSKLAKTSEFGGQAGGAKDEEIKFNRGEVAEGYHALAAFVRLQARPSRAITLEEVVDWIPKIKNGVTFKLPVKDAENKDIADEFHVTISLKPGTWDAFLRPKEILADPEMKKYVTDIIDDANEETGRRADTYATNGKYDLVRVVGDGVSGENETKTDINFENETEKKHRGYSIKAGTTAQIHQVGGGGVKDARGQKKATPEERFRILQDELFGVHGLARIADISSVKDEYLKAAQDESVQGRLRAQEIAYRAAVKSLNDSLISDDDEKVFVKTFAKALKFFLAREDENILLKQFSGQGTWILDPKRFDQLHDQGLDLVAEYTGSKANPEIRVFDTFSNKDLIVFRTYKAASGYMRNYIEKGDLFKELTDIKKAKQPGSLADKYIQQLKVMYGSKQKLTPAAKRNVQKIVDRLKPADLKTIANADIKYVSDAAKEKIKNYKIS